MSNTTPRLETAPPRCRSALIRALFCFLIFVLCLAGAAGAAGIDLSTSSDFGNNWVYTYDSGNQTGTLTLNGGTWDNITSTGVSNLIIKLNGTNFVTGSSTGKGISVNYGNLTIQNAEGKTGSLNVTVESSTTDVHSIYASHSISILSGTVEANAKATGTGKNAYGICAHKSDLTISGGNVNAKANSTNKDASGIYTEGILTISDGEVTAEAEGKLARGIYSTKDIIISGATVTTNAKSGESTASGIYAYHSISISGGTVKADAVSSGENAYGICSQGEFAISSGMVIANANAEAETDGKYACGLGSEGDSVTISGGTVTAKANGKHPRGILAAESITISGGTVNAEATGGTAYGLYANNGVSNSPVTLTINNGIQQIIAKGSTQALLAKTSITIGNVLFVKASANIDGSNAQTVASSALSGQQSDYQYVFIKIPTVVFDTDGGTPVPDPQTVQSGGKVTEPTAPTKTGYTFNGWYNTSTFTLPKWDFNTDTVSEDMTLYAQWSENSQAVTPGGGDPEPSTSSGSKDTGSGKYFEYPRTVSNGGSVSFGTSPVVAEVILPQGSAGSVVLKVESVEDWPGVEKTAYGFDITASGKAEGTAQIIFKIKLTDLERLDVLPKDIGIFHKAGEEWVQLKTVYEIKDEYVYYTAETDTFSPFEIRFVENGAVPKDSTEPIEPVIPPTETPDEPEDLPPIEPVKPDTPESPMPILAVLAGLGAAALLRRN